MSEDRTPYIIEPVPIPKPEVWTWDINLDSKHVKLRTVNPVCGNIIMDFVRYGMGMAAPRFNVNGIMHRADELTAVVPGREHHKSWFRTIDHPQARLISQAPTMEYALKQIIAQCEFTWAPCTRFVERIKAMAEEGLGIKPE